MGHVFCRGTTEARIAWGDKVFEILAPGQILSETVFWLDTDESIIYRWTGQFWQIVNDNEGIPFNLSDRVIGHFSVNYVGTPDGNVVEVIEYKETYVVPEGDVECRMEFAEF